MESDSESLIMKKKGKGNKYINIGRIKQSFSNNKTGWLVTKPVSGSSYGCHIPIAAI